MKTILITMLMVATNVWAQDNTPQDELQLPQTYYSVKQHKTVVEVKVDENNQQNYQDQETLVNNLIDQLGENQVVIKEK